MLSSKNISTVCVCVIQMSVIEANSSFINNCEGWEHEREHLRKSQLAVAYNLRLQTILWLFQIMDMTEHDKA